MTRLSTTCKDNWLVKKLKEQNLLCILCLYEITNTEQNYIDYDHLDDNPENNKITNVAVVHKRCNLIKRFDKDFKKKALDWKKHLEAEERSALRESKGVLNADTHADADTRIPIVEFEPEQLTEAQINLTINKLTKATLDEILPIGSTKQVPFGTLLADIHWLLMEQTGGRGSETSVRRSLNGMTKSTLAHWQVKTLGYGNRVVQRRQK